MSINERIRSIIENDYSSQSELANAIGVSRVTVGSYVNTDSKPNSEVLESFYKLGYNINWLISGEGSKTRELMNFEQLDKYDDLIINSYITTFAGLTKNPKFLPDGIIVSDKEKSMYVLDSLYQFGVIYALKIYLANIDTFTKLESLIHSSVYGDNLFFLEKIIINEYLPVIDHFLTKSVRPEQINFKLNSNKDQEYFLEYMSIIYVFYTEILEFELKLNRTDGRIGLSKTKQTFIEILENMDNLESISLKAERFKNSIAQVFNIDSMNN